MNELHFLYSELKFSSNWLDSVTILLGRCLLIFFCFFGVFLSVVHSMAFVCLCGRQCVWEEISRVNSFVVWGKCKPVQLVELFAMYAWASVSCWSCTAQGECSTWSLKNNRQCTGGELFNHENQGAPNRDQEKCLGCYNTGGSWDSESVNLMLQ